MATAAVRGIRASADVNRNTSALLLHFSIRERRIQRAFGSTR